MKKKAVLLFLALVGALAVHAEDAYTYLTFETTDGARVSVPVASLTLTISGHTLTAGTQSFTLSNLTKMYFSTGDETTGIETMDNGQWTILRKSTTCRATRCRGSRCGRAYIS